MAGLRKHQRARGLALLETAIVLGLLPILQPGLLELSADPDSLTPGRAFTVTVDLPVRNKFDIVRFGQVPVPENLHSQVSMATENV